MKKEPLTVEQIISASVAASFEVALNGIELKLQEALELGAKIGAAKGAEVGAKAAMRAVEKEKQRYRQQHYDKQYQNTKLLLRYYRSLNAHYENAAFDTSTAESEDTFVDVMELMDGYSYDENLYVESIKRSAIKTSIIMAHVNKMLEIYEIMCERSKRDDDKRHWRVLQALYIGDEPTTASELAGRENIDKRTVYKDIDAAAADMTALLFGIEGVEKL